MRPHLPALDHGRMDPAPARYVIRINGHLGATLLSAFPALAPQHHDAHTVLTCGFLLPLVCERRAATAGATGNSR